MNSQTLMPVLFLGHGSPMNAIADNDFTRALSKLHERIPEPRAILCVSAHWMTEGSWITHMEKPRTIHDFYGFPQELFEVQYPAPGAPFIAKEIQETVIDPKIHLDSEMWGLDHGTWSVLRHVYPRAHIPVMQLSLYMEQPMEYHHKLAVELRKLRSQGILIVGSGNIVHNLRQIKWEADAKAYPWAIEFDEYIKDKLEERDYETIIRDGLKSSAARMSVPTLEHYLPFIYTLGAALPDDEMEFLYEEIQNASISMRCIGFGMR